MRQPRWVRRTGRVRRVHRGLAAAYTLVMTEADTLPRRWTTERLELRPFRLSDAPAVLAYASDEQWGRFLPVPVPYTAVEADRFVAAQLLADHHEAPRWALELHGEAVGAVEVKFEHGKGVASLHYAIARKVWRRGLMTEAVRSIVNRVFAELPHIERIQSWADVRNVGSWRVMEKCGLVREGVYRSRRVVHGERVDDVHYAILRGDWVRAEDQGGS